MAVSIEDIKKLRAMTGAGLADVKKALTEAEGDFDKAKELLRERGLAIAAKRSDRETSNGCVLVKKVNDFAAIIALKCETDFVANGADFIKLTSDILDAAIAAKAQTLDEVKALKIGDSDAQAAVTQRSGITGEKMELDGYCVLEGENIEVYDHMNKHTLCTMVQLNENNEEAGHKVAMQVAAMRPVALDESSVSEETKKTELEVAVAKTKEELVEKAVNAALKKAGIKQTVMLTGDVKSVADKVASELHIDKVYSELLPQDKVNKVEELLSLKQSKENLAFVGDGINDAPVLSRADIGIAMGALGSDAAIEAADIVLMDDDPLKISKAIKIAKKCIHIVYENIYFAIGIKLVCLILGAIGIANMWVAIFADVGVMIIAVLNAIRALNVKNL